jgi:small subunit ribosomal protein S1
MTTTPAAANPPMEDFAKLFEESLTKQEMRQGELITAEVVRVDFNVVVVNAGLKSESFINIDEFKNDKGEIEVKPGDFVTVAIESLEDGYGETKLSRDKAKRLKAWHDLEAAMEQGLIVQGLVTSKVKGGLTVMINGIRAFLPGSLVDIRPVKDTSPFENKALDFKVIKLDRKRNNVVVSRRAVLEESQGRSAREAPVHAVGRRDRQGHRQEHHRLRRVRGPGRHRRPAAHHRPRMASREASVGSARGRRRSHGQGPQVRPGEEPRLARHEAAGRRPVGRPSRRYPQGTRLFGKVTNITDYGAFVEIESGIEGLVHVSRWTGPTRTSTRPRSCSSATKSR